MEINRISAPECCYRPAGTAHMIGKIQTRLMVHICTGCYGQALGNLPKDSGTEVLMLPELVARAMHQST
jgi:hypothetical protein